MSLAHLLVYTTTLFGLAWVVGHAKVSLPLRLWLADRGKFAVILVELIECPGCFGFWAGGIAGTLLAPHIGHPGWQGRLLVSVVASFYTAGANVLLAKICGLAPGGLTSTNDGEVIT